MFSKEELIEMLEHSGVDYNMDSSTPGISYEDGTFEKYSEVQLPSKYFEECERDGAYPSVNVRINKLPSTNYSFNENISWNMKYVDKNNIQNESLGFAA